MVALLLLMVTGCGAGGGGSTTFIATPVITAEAESTKVTISWQDIPAAQSYNIYWSTDASMTKATSHKVTVSHSPYVHSGLSAGTSYYYFVASVSATGVESAVSDKIQIQTTPLPNSAPSASFTLPASALYGDAVVIDASTSSDSDGTIAEYRFDFGDGSPPSIQTSPLVSHAFLNRGTFAVTVKATDNAGSSSTVSKEITIGFATHDVVNVSSNPTLSQEAVAAVDSSGRVGMVWSDYGGLLLARSAPGGSTTFTRLGSWADPSYTFYSPAIASTGGEYYVSWTADYVAGAAEIAFSRSTDGGQSFSTPVIVSTRDDISSSGSSISAEGSNVVIAWSDAYVWGADPRPQGITYSRSTDGGRTFSRPTNLAPGAGPKAILRNGRTYLSWADGNANGIFFASSHDGVTFTSPKELSTAKVYTWSPQMAIAPDGAIYVMWPQRQDSEQIRVMLAVSRDGGTTFSAPAVVSDPSVTAWGNSLVVGQDGTVFVAWTTGVNYPSPPYTAYLQYSVDHGATFSHAMKITAIDSQSGGTSLVPITTDTVGVLWWGPVGSSNPLSDIMYTTLRIPH